MTLLIGVHHAEENLEAMINRLGYEEIAGMKVMLESCSYPAISQVNIGSSRVDVDHSAVKFWNGISRYVLNRNGLLVFGENEYLYYEAFKEMRRLSELMYEERTQSYKRLKHIPQFPGDTDIPTNQEYKEWRIEDAIVQKRIEQFRLQYNQTPHAKRDPHFAKVLIEEKPDIAILGGAHIPYLIENCFPDYHYSICFIPIEANPYTKD